LADSSRTFGRLRTETEYSAATIACLVAARRVL
jgi:hypothetical protein